METRITIGIKYDPLSERLMEFCAKDKALHDKVCNMSVNNQLFVATTQRNKVQLHLSDEALDLLYKCEGK